MKPKFRGGPYRPWSFDVQFDYGNHLVRVKGTAEPYIPAKGPTFNDPGSPAEGGGFEDLEIWAVRGEKERKLYSNLENDLGENGQFLDALSEALNADGDPYE